MARRNNHNDDKHPTVGWPDVSAMIGRLEAAYGGHVEVSLDVEGTRGHSGACWVYAKAWEGFQVQGKRPTDVVRALWPTNQHKTMAGCMFRLLWQLDHALDARRRSEAVEG